jgi:hypothetical protein
LWKNTRCVNILKPGIKFDKSESLLEIGFFTMPLHPAGSDLTETLDADLEQLVILDGLGFREAWIGEHFPTCS